VGRHHEGRKPDRRRGRDRSRQRRGSRGYRRRLERGARDGRGRGGSRTPARYEPKEHHDDRRAHDVEGSPAMPFRPAHFVQWVSK
jgi:hypothetical protein